MNIREKDIERYIRYPESLSEADRNRIRDEIAGNSVLQQLAGWFRDFYEITEMEFKKEVRKPARIKLLPAEKSEPAKTHRFVLAAMGGDKTASGPPLPILFA